MKNQNIHWIENRPISIGNLTILIGHYPKLHHVSEEHTFVTPLKQHTRTPRTDPGKRRYYEGDYHKVIKLPMNRNRTFNEDTPTVYIRSSQDIPYAIAVLVTRIASLTERLEVNKNIVGSSGGIDRGHKKWNMRLWWQIQEQMNQLEKNWPYHQEYEYSTGLQYNEFIEFLNQAFPGWENIGTNIVEMPERNSVQPKRIRFQNSPVETPVRSIPRMPPFQASESNINPHQETWRKGGKGVNHDQNHKKAKKLQRHQE
jgi:hypothetical protein